MNDLGDLRVSYFGDWVFYTGPSFIESPFENMAKDCSLHFLGKPVTQALEQAGATVKAYSNWDLYHMSPNDYAAVLEGSDVTIVSDVEARCFHLSPSFFDRQLYGKRIVTFPDRLKCLAARVEAGMGLIYLGGWLTFSGHMEKGGWRRAPISDWLPFTCLAGEDLMESSEGFSVRVRGAGHPIFAGLPLDQIPPILGYNEFVPKPDMEVVWEVAETGHPLLGVATRGKGRLAIYASDPVPHWGLNFMLWEGYPSFWRQMVAWVAGLR